MLEVLCGTKNIERILLFLFVNSKCYGTQLHKLLRIPLTPIQKALHRLERGGLIMSYYEGKTRLYQFNPSYPLLSELEQLLKKAYTLLPAHQKKDFYVMKQEDYYSQNVENRRVLLDFWEKLMNVKQLAFHAKTKSKDIHGWNGKGKGEVVIMKEGENVLIFHEKGTWLDSQKAEVGFSNVFRWILDRQAGMISLEHLRRGPEHPVFLFDLAPSGKHSLSSVDSHLCGEDTYFAHIHFDRRTFRLNWRVIGPKKNEEIDYYYS